MKHCSICANAGLPVEVYGTHFVRETRDISSRVTCPLLKNNICSKCGKKGHFAGSCKVVFREKKEVKQVAVSKVAVANTFDFGSESEDESLPVESEKDRSSVLTLAYWQKENVGLLFEEKDKRNTAKYYWDANYELFCANGYIIFEKEVLRDGEPHTINVIKPVKSSWADDEDDI